ncbi:zinc ribbon domain-containing protein [Natribaculum luteum]|uniref:Zinc ribbon domain-containing protein n=1 Tax=Natribaculum luteum TaxID=1586232 RepID=A0ABD5NZ53_9EURY|nr:zinc ribbon domain-containing protein [Natribaculum luteum]
MGNDCTAIAFENPKLERFKVPAVGVPRTPTARRIQGRRIRYRGGRYGIEVDDVAPQYTSQWCSHSGCGFTHRDNRDGDKFEFLKGGKELHSDYNAAKNIANRHCGAGMPIAGRNLAVDGPPVNWPSSQGRLT